MRADPRVSTSSVEKLSTLSEENENEVKETKPTSSKEIRANGKLTQHELNNNINNNNRKLILSQQTSTSSSVTGDELRDAVFVDISGSAPSTPSKTHSSAPTTPQTDSWVGVGTWRRRRLSSVKAKSLKSEDEELGLENVIPYHRSPKALTEMGKFRCISTYYWTYTNKYTFTYVARLVNENVNKLVKLCCTY